MANLQTVPLLDPDKFPHEIRSAIGGFVIAMGSLEHELTLGKGRIDGADWDEKRRIGKQLFSIRKK